MDGVPVPCPLDDEETERVIMPEISVITVRQASI